MLFGLKLQLTNQNQITKNFIIFSMTRLARLQDLMSWLSYIYKNIKTMEINALTAISPVDGRYSNKVENLWKYFSEFALIKYRVFVEIEYFIALCEIPLPQLH